MGKFVACGLLVFMVAGLVQASVLPTPKPDHVAGSTFTQALTEVRQVMNSLPLIMAMDPACISDFGRSASFQEQMRQMLAFSKDEKAKARVLSILEANRIWIEKTPEKQVRPDVREKPRTPADKALGANLDRQLELLAQLYPLIDLENNGKRLTPGQKARKTELANQLQRLNDQAKKMARNEAGRKVNEQIGRLVEQAAQAPKEFILQNNWVRQIKSLQDQAGAARLTNDIASERDRATAAPYVGIFAAPQVDQTQVYLLGSVQWGGDEGSRTEARIKVGANIPVCKDSKTGRPTGIASCQVDLDKGQFNLGFNVPVGDEKDRGRMSGKIAIGPGSKGNFILQGVGLDYQYAGRFAEASRLKTAGIQFEADDRDRLYLAGASVDLGLSNGRQVTAEYVHQKGGDMALRAVRLSYKNNQPVIPEGKQAGTRLSEITATFNLDNPDVLEEIAVVVESGQQKTTEESQVEESESKFGITGTVKNENRANRYVFRYGSLASASGYLPPELTRGLSRLQYAAKNKVVSVAVQSGKMTRTDHFAQTSEGQFDTEAMLYRAVRTSEFYQKMSRQDQQFLTILDPTDLSNSLLLMRVRTDKDRQAMSGFLAFDGRGFRGLALEQDLPRKVATVATETTESDEVMHVRTQSVTRKESDPTLNKVFLSVLPVRASGGKDQRNEFELRMGVEAAVGVTRGITREGKTGAVPNYFSFEFTVKGGKLAFDSRSIAKQIAQKAIQLAQAGNEAPSGPQGVPGTGYGPQKPLLQTEPLDPQKAALIKNMKQVDVASLQAVLEDVLAAAFDPNLKGPAAEQVAQIARDGKLQQAYLAAESVRSQPVVDLATINPDEALAARNHDNLKDVCVVSKDGSAECVFPSNGFKTDATSKLKELLANRYVVSDVKPVAAGIKAHAHALVSASSSSNGLVTTKTLPSCQEYSQLIGADPSVCNKKIAAMVKEQPELFDSTLGEEMIFEQGRCLTDKGNYRFGVFRFDLKQTHPLREKGDVAGIRPGYIS